MTPFERVARGMIASRRSAGTRSLYETDLRRWLAHCAAAGVEPENPTQEAANSFRAGLEMELEPLTIRRILAALSKMYRSAIGARVTSWNPFDPDTLPRPPADVYSATDAFSGDEVEALLAEAAKDGELGIRDHAILRLMADTGLRVTSVCSIRRSAIKRREEGMVIEVTVKGAKHRLVNVPLAAAEAIEAWLARAPLSEYLFPGRTRGCLKRKAVNERLMVYGARARVKNPHPHRFRAAFATAALDGGALLHDVQAAMHHEDPKTTLRYDRGVRGANVTSLVAKYRESKGKEK